MVANQDVVIARNNGYRFVFRGVDTFKSKKSQPVIVLPLTNLSAANTFLFRLFGPSETININFVIFDDGVDVAAGTYTSTVTTVSEQIKYLKDEIFTEDYDDLWEIWETKDLVFPVGAKATGILTDLEMDLTSKANVYVPGSLSFQRGRIGIL